MKYAPFELIEEVEGFYCHSVWKDEKEYFVTGAKSVNNKLTIIFLEAEKETEYVRTAEQAFKEFKFLNKPFGKSVEE